MTVSHEIVGMHNFDMLLNFVRLAWRTKKKKKNENKSRTNIYVITVLWDQFIYHGLSLVYVTNTKPVPVRSLFLILNTSLASWFSVQFLQQNLTKKKSLCTLYRLTSGSLNMGSEDHYTQHARLMSSRRCESWRHEPWNKSKCVLDRHTCSVHGQRRLYGAGQLGAIKRIVFPSATWELN